MKTPAGTDRLSTLPDDLLALILTRISIKCAIKCSVLSKRWRYVYTQIPELRLSPGLFGHRVNLDQLKMARAESIISNILLLHASDLDGFHLNGFHLCGSDNYGTIECQFTSESLCKWLRYLGWKNVQRLTLSGTITNNLRGQILPSALFSCTRLTELTLYYYAFPIKFPTHFTGFNHLITCYFVSVDFTDDYLACLISHCPLLQKLTIIKCNGLQKPDVSALNLTYLEVEADEMEVLTLNCPKLISLNAVSCPISDLSVNGVLFYEFSFMVRVLKLQCGNDVTELWLDSSVVDSEGNLSAERLFEMVWAFKSLKKLSMDIYELLEREREGMSVPFVKLFERLPHLERLEMRGRFFRELTGDEIPPCLSSPLVNLRIIQVHIDDSDSMEINERQIAMLGCLLQSTPSLEILKFQLLSDLYVTAQHTGVVEKILRLRGTSTQARIFQGLIL